MAVKLVYEIRLPPGTSAPARTDFAIELRTPKEVVQASSDFIRMQQDGDRAVLHGEFRVSVSRRNAWLRSAWGTAQPICSRCNCRRGRRAIPTG